MLGRYTLIPGGQKNPHPRRGRHRRSPRVRAPPLHLPIDLRRPRIFPYELCFSKFAAGHIDVVILDPDECVCHLHGSSTDLARMFGRGSPRMNLIQAATMKKISPRSTTNKRKKRTSPKVGRLRANWNSGLEKGLVEILQDHNNDCYKGQNGWSSEAWNRIVKLFHEKFSYVTFTKCQIQDKEKELKRDYKALKEARQQSGVSWDERLCRIEAEEPIWNNLTTSNERLKKFRTKSFPLFEALGELYDGNIAEGTMNFTSIEPSRPPVTQPCQAAFTLTQPSQIAFTQPSLAAFARPSRTAFRHPSLAAFPQPSQAAFAQPSQTIFTQPSEATFTQPSEATFTQPSEATFTQPSQAAFTQPSQANISQAICDEDDELRVLDPPAPASVSKRAKNVGTGNSRTRINKRTQDGNVVEMMGRFLEMKEKQAEADERATTNANEDDFPIQTCIAIVDGMEEFSDDEKVDSYDVFKDAQNRAIFMTAKDATRIKWLRKKIART
uniref:Myb/SANT-like domain-containing protein n=1 Tax=Zea mays TaxID=4577 RepID=A0A804LJG5_MAIZE